MLYPFKIVQVPLNRLAQAASERLPWPPAEFALNLGNIHGIAAVVAWAIFDKGDQAFIGSLGRFEFVQNGADLPHHLKIRHLLSSTNVVSLPRNTSIQQSSD